MADQTTKKRYAIVGASHRASRLFLGPILNGYSDVAECVAIVDIDAGRMRLMNDEFGSDIPTWSAEKSDEMLEACGPDTVIVASTDATHHTYIIAALKRGLDVISEKPLTIDAENCRAILAAEAESKGRVTVTFNYRYSPLATAVREMIAGGSVGRVVSVDLSWCLDTYHGSSYFMRWNRRRSESGGLNVHKATHHFDLVQWWTGQKPVEVSAFGGRHFYGPEGPRNPRQVDGRHCPTCDDRDGCEYYTRWHTDDGNDAELDEHVGGLQTLSHYTDYSARQCIYDSEVDIEDTFAAIVRYDGGAILNYSLNASTPYEGFRVAINGLDGRIETSTVHAANRAPHPEPPDEPIVYMPMFGGYEEIRPPESEGGHGGSDPLMLAELLRGPDPAARVARQADLTDGVLSVLVGVAVHRSMTEGRPIRIEELLRG